MKVYIKLLIPIVFVFGMLTLNSRVWHPIHAASSMYDSSGSSNNFIFLPVVLNNYCKAQYLDDFSDPGSGWPILDNTVRYEYLNGEYRIWVKDWYAWAGAAPGVKASDFTVFVDVRSGPNHILPGSYGLLFGLSDDWTQFYTFEIYTEFGYYQLMKYESGVWTILAEGYANVLQTSNQLRIVRADTQIDAYLNNQLLITTSDGSFIGPRRLGLIATHNSFEGNTDGFFDNFTICGASDFTPNFMTLQSNSWALR
ncbi:MAG: hypothetical protein DHS20C20_19810 [Ardenticatenaceae bacterium]|nr:MAG: hypothetical protein DHS20C20_19810 [Ardenticatenaceae bacterium]